MCRALWPDAESIHKKMHSRNSSPHCLQRLVAHVCCCAYNLSSLPAGCLHLHKPCAASRLILWSASSILRQDLYLDLVIEVLQVAYAAPILKLLQLRAQTFWQR